MVDAQVASLDSQDQQCDKVVLISYYGWVCYWLTQFFLICRRVKVRG